MYLMNYGYFDCGKADEWGRFWVLSCISLIRTTKGKYLEKLIVRSWNRNQSILWQIVFSNILQPAEKLALFKGAHAKHLQLLKECASGEGCDRHLLGLYIIAQEEGRPIPELFTDPAFSKRLVTYSAVQSRNTVCAFIKHSRYLHYTWISL